MLILMLVSSKGLTPSSARAFCAILEVLRVIVREMTFRHFFPSLIPLFIVSSVPPSATCREKNATPYLTRLKPPTAQRHRFYCSLNLNIVLKEWKHLLSLLSDSEALRLTAFNNILSVSCCHLSFVQHSLGLLPLFSNLSLNCCKQAKHGLCIPKCRQSSSLNDPVVKKSHMRNCAHALVLISSALMVDFCGLCSLPTRPHGNEYRTIGLNILEELIFGNLVPKR